MSEELKPETRMEELLLKRLEALEQQVAQMRDVLTASAQRPMFHINPAGMVVGYGQDGDVVIP